jgi:hypothetical protein
VLTASLALGVIARNRESMAPRKRNESLPDAEVQELADTALKAWEVGTEQGRTDSLGGVWTFLSVRSPEAALTLHRRLHEGPQISARVSGLEIGAHNAIRAKLASMVNAIVSPP